jgi:hypothetical protein
MRALNWVRPPPALFSLGISRGPDGPRMSVVFFAIRVISSCDSIQVAGASIDARSPQAVLAGRLAGARGARLHRIATLFAPAMRCFWRRRRANIHPPRGPTCLKPNRSDIYAAFRCRQKQACAVAAPQFRLTGLMRNAVRDVEHTGRDRLEIAKGRPPCGRSAMLGSGRSNAKRW